MEECDDLVLWFHQGDYVIKALELKSRLETLSPEQQSIYDHRNEYVPNKAELVEAAMPTLEKVITENMPTSEEEAITDSIITATQRELAQAVSQHAAEAQKDVQQDESWRYHTGHSLPASRPGRSRQSRSFHRSRKHSRRPQGCGWRICKGSWPTACVRSWPESQRRKVMRELSSP